MDVVLPYNGRGDLCMRIFSLDLRLVKSLRVLIVQCTFINLIVQSEREYESTASIIIGVPYTKSG